MSKPSVTQWSEAVTRCLRRGMLIWERSKPSVTQWSEAVTRCLRRGMLIWESQ